MFYSVSSYLCCCHLRKNEELSTKEKAAILSDVFFSAITLLGLTFAVVSIYKIHLGPLNSISQFLGDKVLKSLAIGTGAFLGIQMILSAVHFCKQGLSKKEKEERKTAGIGSETATYPPIIVITPAEQTQRPAFETPQKKGNFPYPATPVQPKFLSPNCSPIPRSPVLSNLLSPQKTPIKEENIEEETHAIVQLMLDTSQRLLDLEKSMEEETDPEEQLKIAENALEWSKVQKALTEDFYPLPPPPSPLKENIPIIRMEDLPPPPSPVAEVHTLLHEVQTTQTALEKALIEQREKLKKTATQKKLTVQDELKSGRPQLKHVVQETKKKEDPVLTTLNSQIAKLRKTEPKQNKKEKTEDSPLVKSLTHNLLKASTQLAAKTIEVNLDEQDLNWKKEAQEEMGEPIQEVRKDLGIQLSTYSPVKKPSEQMKEIRENAKRNANTPQFKELAKVLSQNRLNIADSPNGSFEQDDN